MSLTTWSCRDVEDTHCQRPRSRQSFLHTCLRWYFEMIRISQQGSYLDVCYLLWVGLSIFVNKFCWMSIKMRVYCWFVRGRNVRVEMLVDFYNAFELKKCVLGIKVVLSVQNIE